MSTALIAMTAFGFMEAVFVSAAVSMGFSHDICIAHCVLPMRAILGQRGISTYGLSRTHEGGSSPSYIGV